MFQGTVPRHPLPYTEAVTSPPDPDRPPDALSNAGPSDDADQTVHTPESVFAALVAGGVDLDAEQLAVLSDLNPDAAQGFVGALATQEASVRFALLNNLVEAERGSRLLDFSALYQSTTHDDDPAVRALAVAGLATCEDPAMIPDLLEAAQSDPDETVRSEAAIALAGFALRAELGQLLPRAAERVVEGLRAIAQDPSEDPTVQAAAIASLGAISQAWVQDLIYDAYESTDPALRVGALQAMGRTADEYWLPTLVNAMQSADSDERYAAARAAGEIASEDAIIPLAGLLEDEALDVVEAAAAALGEIGGPVAAEQLQEYESHPDSGIRAAIGLGLQAAAFHDDPLGIANMAGPFTPPLDARPEGANDG